MISARGLCKSYRDPEGNDLRVLEGAELHVRAGEMLAVVGPSGCGKSTLLNVLGGLDGRYQGEVEIAGTRLTGLSDRALAAFRHRTVGFVFQSFNLIAPLSAVENVLLPSFFGPRGASESELRARAIGALERVGLAHKAGQLPGRLSGGERQRVAIARALFGEPRIILCDEPTGNLDATTGADIVRFFVKLAREEGLTLVIVTHEERVSQAADRVLRLRGGKLVEEGGQGGVSTGGGR